MEQVREIVDPGFTNTELFPWITAAAAVKRIFFLYGRLNSVEKNIFIIFIANPLQIMTLMTFNNQTSLFAQQL